MAPQPPFPPSAPPDRPAHAGDFLLVTGQRIGTVVLGMDRTSVHVLLHAPTTTRRADGLRIDTWLSHQVLTAHPDGIRGLKRDYLTVFFQHGHAIQIEVGAPQFVTAQGLSTRRSPSRFG